MKKRLLSILLILCTALTLLSVSVFAPSIQDICNANYGFATEISRMAEPINSTGYGTRYWTRSYVVNTKESLAAYVDGMGGLVTPQFADKAAVRPAMNLAISDASKIRFTSAIGGKEASGMDAGLKTVASASGSEWKLTLTDSSRNFTTGTACKAGDAIYLNYSGAKTGANEYISAIVKTSSGTISYYGRLKNLANEADASGAVKIDLSGVTMAADDTLYIFNEQYNGKQSTDYASELQTLPDTFEDGYPVINTLKNITTSNPSGYVKAGEAYSAVLTVTSGYMLPECVTVTINGNVLTAENYAYSSETGLLAIAADKIAGSVEIIATGAKKTWRIELDPDKVDFGTLPFGYDVPAAQAVTIKNTGNQPVTVGLPELDFGEDAFVFTQGDGYTGGQAAIAADAAASFTVQPKTGLPVGDYAFTTYTINGSDDTEAELFVNFEVTTRGMVVTILARMEGVSTDGSPWYEAGRRWAMANNISDGTNMESPVTREQLAAILYRYAAYKGADVSVGEQAGMQRYTDASAISEYAVPAMQWACGTGLLQGAGSKLLQKGLAIRAQLAAMLHRYLTK